MIVILIGAILAATMAAFLAGPLVREGAKREASGVVFFICVASAGLYLWLGHPDLKSAAAVYETSGPRAARRALVAQELTLMQALSEKPDSLRLMLALADVQMKQGHLDEAVRILELARDRHHDHHDVRLELGAAYYAQGVKLLMDDNREEAESLFNKAMKTAPEDAPYRSRLREDIKRNNP